MQKVKTLTSKTTKKLGQKTSKDETLQGKGRALQMKLHMKPSKVNTPQEGGDTQSGRPSSS